MFEWLKGQLARVGKREPKESKGPVQIKPTVVSIVPVQLSSPPIIPPQNTENASPVAVSPPLSVKTEIRDPESIIPSLTAVPNLNAKVKQLQAALEVLDRKLAFLNETNRHFVLINVPIGEALSIAKTEQNIAHSARLFSMGLSKGLREEVVKTSKSWSTSGKWIDGVERFLIKLYPIAASSVRMSEAAESVILKL